MIIKSFELNKINLEKNNFFLLYGENEGFKNEVIKKKFEKNFDKNIYRYDEKEILDNKENFFNSITTKSFFEDKKLIIISRTTDKIKDLIDHILEKKINDIVVILNSNILEKKSKLRNMFEKDKKAVCMPFYADNNITLGKIVNNFFKEKNIAISQQNINLVIERCRGDRQNLNNELNKIENFTKNKKNIKFDEILKLTNLAENYNVSELIDSCLVKNHKKTINILNENNYSIDDCFLITRTLLIKSKRLFELKKKVQNNTNVDEIISSFKPPIFWKDKENVKIQIKNWSIESIENLIYKSMDLELLIKKNSVNSINMISDFLINKSKKTNN